MRMAACVCRDEGRSPEERQTHAAGAFSRNGVVVVVICRVRLSLEGERRCPGDISTIIR
jgi:hypothetical protein